MRHRVLCGLSVAAGALGAASVLLSPCCAFAGPGELQGAFSSTQWATIGDVGNRRPTDAEVGRAPPAHRPHPGSVDYEYRIATTEVTVGQHLEFLQAYSPFMPVGTVNASFGTTGQWINLANFGVNEPPVFSSPSARHNWATTMSMRLAARMVNWLHNGQVNEAWAFESGVYDTSTFGEGPDGVGITDDYTRAPGARFWIPSIDEYYKAAFYDPSKPNDDGSLGGYWQYPNGSDDPPIPGLPENGGDTNRSIGTPVDVGSYAHVLSPWGLLDVSGGEAEMTDTQVFAGSMSMYAFLSARNGSSTYFSDALWSWRSGIDNVVSGSAGYRLASVVPAPSGAVLLAVSACFIAMRRRLSHGK